MESEAPLESLFESVRAEVQAVDSDIPAYSIRSLKDIIDESLGRRHDHGQDHERGRGNRPRAWHWPDVYGVMAYSVSQRRSGTRDSHGARGAGTATSSG